MTDTTLPADYEVGPVVLHADGSITVGGSLTLRNQTLTNHRFADGALEVISKRGSTRVDIRFDRGQRRIFQFSRCAWRELSEEEAAGTIWQGILLLRRIHWTTRKAAIAGSGGLLIVCLVVWLVAGGGGAPGPKDSKAVSGSKKEAPAIPPPAGAGRVGGDASAKPANGSSQAQTKPKLSDDEILRSQHLTFEEKRSQLYDLADSAEAVVNDLREQANYGRTQSRLGRFQLRLSKEAEQGLSLLVDRISEALVRVTEYRVNVELQVSAIRKLEPKLFEQLKSGSLDPSLRQLYVDITTPKLPLNIGCYWNVFDGVTYAVSSEKRLCDGYVLSSFGQVDSPADPSITSSIKANIMRGSVTAGDLFSQLVAIRCCQRTIEVLGPADDRIDRFLHPLPDDLLAVGGFDRKWPELKTRFLATLAKQNQPDEKPQPAAKPTSDADAPRKKVGPNPRDVFDGLKKEKEKDTETDKDYEIPDGRLLVDRLREVTPTPKGVLMEPKDRERLLAQLAEDAGVLEDALQEQLLAYPWPWKVSTVKPKKKLFELISQPAAEQGS